MSPEPGFTERQVLELEQRRAAASLAADTEQLDTLIDANCLYVHSTGDVDAKLSYLAKLRSGDLRYTDIELSEQTVSIHGSCGVVTFRMEAAAEIAGHPRALRSRCTAVWALGGDGRLIAFQSTALPSIP